MDFTFSTETLLSTALIAGPVVSILGSVARSLTKKYGMETSRTILQLGLFVVAVVIALVLKFTPQETLLVAGSIFATAIAFYEAITKNLLGVVFKKQEPDAVDPDPAIHP